MNNSFLLALATLVGTVVGAGIFGLPYAAAQSGIGPFLFYFAFLGGVVLVLHLMFGEIALRTQEKHRLIGYASLYLGTWAKRVVTVSTVAGTVGALLAYIIVAGGFLEIVFGSSAPMFSSDEFSVLFWFVLSFFILLGIQAIAKAELFLNIALFAAIGGIFAFTFPHFQMENFRIFDSSNLFLPYGVILFAFWGLPAIPEIAELFKNRKEKGSLDNLIVWASLIPGALFFVFAVVVVGVSGSETSPDALAGLVPFLGTPIVIWGALFGLVAIASSFLVLGNYLKNSLRYDYRLSSHLALGIAIFLPILLFLTGLRDFILVISLVGAVTAAFEGSLVALIWKRAKEKGSREPEYSLRIPQLVPYVLIALLVVGALLEIFEN